MAKKATGTTISINGVLIGGLTSIKPPERTAETIDVTTLDGSSGYRDFIQGFKDGGEVEVTGFYDTSYTGQTNVDTAYENGTEDTYIIAFPVALGGTFTFTGIVTKLVGPGEANVDDPLGFSATFKVKGKPVLAFTASAGLTALALSGGGTLSPTVAAGTLNYSYVFTTATSITVTVTAASHALKLFSDGIYVQDLTSGVASAAITGYVAQSAKELTVVAYESGKSPKVYRILAARTT
ncbi:MAG: phage tail tube protein [Desulfitobacteriaceae bacterium]